MQKKTPLPDTQRVRTVIFNQLLGVAVAGVVWVSVAVVVQLLTNPYIIESTNAKIDEKVDKKEFAVYEARNEEILKQIVTKQDEISKDVKSLLTRSTSLR